MRNILLVSALLLLQSCRVQKVLSQKNVESLIQSAGGPRMSDRWFGPPEATGDNWRYYCSDTADYTIFYETDHRGRLRNAFVWGDGTHRFPFDNYYRLYE